MSDDGFLWPTHAHWPGHNARHPENLFDRVKSSVIPGSTSDQLADCSAFRHGLAYLDKGFFWEAHEVFEPVWMALEDGSVERRFVQGLIQFANARLKLAMGRPKAARRLTAMARALLPDTQMMMGVDVYGLQRRLDELEKYNAL